MIKQVNVTFAIGKYKDEIMCNLVSMHTRHLLLDCLLQYDIKVIHDGYINRYSFIMNGKPMTFVPLSSS